MAKDNSYFMYFPGNYRWSAGFINMLGSAPYGGSDIGELHKIGQLLKDKAPEDDEAWFDACAKVADGVRAHAQRFEGAEHHFSASHAYLRACNYYQMAERFRTPKDDKALAVYRTGVECFHRHAKLSDLRIEIVEVPFESASLPGYFVQAQNARAKRAPCVVFFDGLDVTKEIQFMRGVPDLIKRGIAVLVMDGPGTGEAIRFRGHYLRHDYEVAGSACMDYLEKRDEVDPKKVCVVAISLGGYYSARAGSKEHRLAACISHGAIWDVEQRFRDRGEGHALAKHMKWVFGAKSMAEAIEKAKPFKLEGVLGEMRCPYLVLHGGHDVLGVENSRTVYEYAKSNGVKVTLRLTSAEETGAEHCQHDNPTLGQELMIDWLADVFRIDQRSLGFSP